MITDDGGAPPPAIPDGVYLNLPHEVYLRDRALGSSDLKLCLANSVQFQARRAEGVAELFEQRGDTIATAYGTALHVVALEPEAFEARYCVAADEPDDLPGTIDEIMSALTAIGKQPHKRLPLPDMLALARAWGVQTLADWELAEQVRRAGRHVVSQQWLDAFTMTRHMIEGHSEAHRFLSGGRAEVSVFWTDETGLRLKVRFDYLRTRPVSDVKTYTILEGFDPVESFVIAMKRFGYDFSAAHYMDARTNALPRLVGEGHVYDVRGYPHAEATLQEALDMRGELLNPSETDLEFMRKVADTSDPSWWWVACARALDKKASRFVALPEVDTIEFPRDLMAFASAQTQVELAKENYRRNRDTFGENSLWLGNRGRVRLTEANFDQRTLDRGLARWENAE